MKKIYNFSAGPAVLNKRVLQEASQAGTLYFNHGMSLMEMSHRSAPVVEMVEETKYLARELLNIPKNFHILFLQGGASLQFAMVPMNLLPDDATADYANTGIWSIKAMKEAENYGFINEVCSSGEKNYNSIPNQLTQTKDATYLHLTSNNTIYGTQWHRFPTPLNTNGYLVADMSSDILSREIDWSRIGLIYAGAQKNMGPAGVTLIIVKDNILGKVDRNIPSMLNYQTHIKSRSMFNTPPVFSIYVVNRTLHWLKELGGIPAIKKINERKAKKLYSEIERNSLFSSPVEKQDRSLMNVPFVFTHGGDETSFLFFCEKRGLVSLKGHRSVGGFRASIYNALPEEGVDSLIAAMQDYEEALC